MRLIFCPNGSLSRAVKDTRNATKQVMVIGIFFIIFVQAKICGTMNANVNQEDTVNNKLLCIVSKSQNKNTSTDNPNLGLVVKGRNKGETKFSTPCRRNRIICAIHHCQNANCQEPTNISQHFLAYNKPDLCNGYKSKEPDYDDRFCINFPCHCVLRHILLDTNLLDNVDSWKEVVQ